jgi:hypothetical protein
MVILAVYCNNHTEYMNTLYGQNAKSVTLNLVVQVKRQQASKYHVSHILVGTYMRKFVLWCIICCEMKYFLSIFILIASCSAGYNFKSIGGGSFWHRSNSGSEECKYN